MMGGGFGHRRMVGWGTSASDDDPVPGRRSAPQAMMRPRRPADGGNEWDSHMNLDGGWWMVTGIGMIVFWALVILGVVWLVRELARPHTDGK